MLRTPFSSSSYSPIDDARSGWRPFHSAEKKNDFVNSLVYNVFIAPVYAIAAAFASLAFINAMLFLATFSLCKFSLLIWPSLHPIWLMFICALINSAFLYRFTSTKCSFSLCFTVVSASLLIGFISLYWKNNWPLSTEMTISLGTLLGLNAHVISKETLLDELLEESFDKMTTLRDYPRFA